MEHDMAADGFATHFAGCDLVAPGTKAEFLGTETRLSTLQVEKVTRMNSIGEA